MADHVLLIALERTEVRFRLIDQTIGPSESDVRPAPWDCGPYLTDINGARLVEELIRRLRAFIDHGDVNLVGVAISLPGTLENGIVRRSSRLGIHTEIDLQGELAQRLKVEVVVAHDTDCIAHGEIHHGVLASITPPRSVCLVFADEGVGSTLYVDGNQYRGAGFAGRIGRLVVEPNGGYEHRFEARGPLESYATRPGISSNLVAEYKSEQEKLGGTTTGDKIFRTHLRSAANKQHTDALSISHIVHGVQEHDPIAISVLENSAQYLGLALHSLITIVNPDALILAGRVLTDIPGLADRATSYARRFSYVHAWNQTSIHIASLGTDAQFFGAHHRYATR